MTAYARLPCRRPACRTMADRIETRADPDHPIAPTVLRTYECPSCGYRFSTAEVPVRAEHVQARMRELARERMAFARALARPRVLESRQRRGRATLETSPAVG